MKRPKFEEGWRRAKEGEIAELRCTVLEKKKVLLSWITAPHKHCIWKYRQDSPVATAQGTRLGGSWSGCRPVPCSVSGGDTAHQQGQPPRSSLSKVGGSRRHPWSAGQPRRWGYTGSTCQFPTWEEDEKEPNWVPVRTLYSRNPSLAVGKVLREVWLGIGSWAPNPTIPSCLEFIWTTAKKSIGQPMFISKNHQEKLQLWRLYLFWQNRWTSSKEVGEC